MAESITPVILCGGSGSRLWPLSRPSAPKPFLPLLAGGSLFAQALERCSATDFEPPVIVTGMAHLPLVRSIGDGRQWGEVIVEPMARQTAAAVALAALRLAPDAVMLVCPSDHHIRDSAAFRGAAHEAAELARAGWLVCIGIPPVTAETRFGYLGRGEELDPGGYRVGKFVEKPDPATAATFVESGGYYWNSGIFAMRAGDYLAELEKQRPGIAARARDSVASGELRGLEFHPDEGSFSEIAAESIDYAVMENSRRVAMVIAEDLGWSDVGDWRALHGLRERDGQGNSVQGPAELVDCRDVLVQTDGPKVRAIGLDHVIIVVDGDDILVADARKSFDVAAPDRERD